MSAHFHYCDPDRARRDRVTEALVAAGVPVRPVDDLEAMPPEASLVLVGATELHAMMPRLRRCVDARPDRQVLLLWEGQDPELLLEAVRAGVRDVLIAPAAVVEAARKAIARRAAATEPARRERGRVVVVFSLKGGIGKSTLSANLSVALHRASRRPTTAVDLSLPCGNLEMYLDVQPPRCIGDLLGAGPGLESEMVHQALATHPSGVRVLAGARSHAVESLTRFSMGPILDALGEDGALTVVDMGSFLEMAHATVLERADLVVVPVTPLISSLGTLGQARELLGGFGVGADRLLPVLNHAGPDMPGLSADVVARLMGGAPRHVLPWGGADVARSLNEGVPLVIGQATSPLAEAIDGLARDALARLGVGAAGRPAAPIARASSPLAWLFGLFSPKGVTHVHP